MGQPRTPTKIKPYKIEINTRIEEELLNRIRRYCGKHELSISRFISIASLYYLYKHESETDENP